MEAEEDDKKDEEEGGVNAVTLLNVSDTDPCAAEDLSHDWYKPNMGFGCALFDAHNGFNKLNRYLKCCGMYDIGGQAAASLHLTGIGMKSDAL